MPFNEQQRAAASRLREISARLDAAAEQASAAQVAAGQNAATALVITLAKQYGDALRELLDTL